MHDPRLPPPLRSQRRQSSASGLLTRILSVAAGAVVLIGAVAISFVVFVIALTVLLAIGIYVWWKTRHFRRQLKEQLNAQSSDTTPPGDIIEGEVISKRESDPQQR